MLRRKRDNLKGVLTAIAVAMVLVLVLCIIRISMAAETGNVSLVVVSGRALINSVKVLEGSLGCSITCEEAPYESPQVIKEAFPDGPEGPFTRIVEFRYKAKSDPQMIIQSLVDQHNQQYKDAVYKVAKAENGANIFNVFPVERTNAAGRMLRHESPLAQPVSLSVRRQDSLGSALKRVLDSVKSQYESRFSLDGVHGGNPMGVEMEFIDKPALVCLNEMFEKFRTLRMGGPLSWSLRRGPAIARFRGSKVVAWDFGVFAVRRVDPAPVVGDVTISIEAERTIAVAAQILEKMLNCTITYEDNEYACDRDLMFNWAREPQRLSGEMLDFSFQKSGDKEQTIKDMLAKSRRYGVFEVRRISEDHFAVYPVQAHNPKGDLVPVTALSRRPVSLSSNRVKVGDALAAYVRTLEKETGKRVSLADLPDELATPVVSLNVKEEPVAKGLTDLLQSVDSRWSWHLLYFVKTKDYRLSVHRRGDPLPDVWDGTPGPSATRGRDIAGAPPRR